MVVALSLRGDVLPQLAGRQAGPCRVVTATGDPVAASAALAARHELVGGQVGDGVREGAQEAVQEVTYSCGQSGQLHTLHQDKTVTKCRFESSDRNLRWYKPGGTS